VQKEIDNNQKLKEKKKKKIKNRNEFMLRGSAIDQLNQ
jgi:hypothetical protein